MALSPISGVTQPVIGVQPQQVPGSQGMTISPFGMGQAVVNGNGNIQIGPMGIASVQQGPMPITPANTVNRLGIASPFAQPFGSFNPITPNSFGPTNPFSPTSVTPYASFNTLPFGSFGPAPNVLSPVTNLGALQGGDPMSAQFGSFNALLSPMSLGSAITSGNMGGIPQQSFAPTQSFALAPQPMTMGTNQTSVMNTLNQVLFNQPLGTQVPAQMPIPQPPPSFDTSSFMGLLSSGFGSWSLTNTNQSALALQPQLMGQSAFATQPQQGVPGFMTAQGFVPAQQQQPVPGFMTQQGFIPAQQANAIGGVNAQALSNPFTQQNAIQASAPGTGGRMVTPFGTFTTSIGPGGGMANAGFLGAQAAGQAFGMVTHPLNPGMIVDYANPFYSSFNFNQGFFAA